jgi:hypothetical protein
VRTSLLSLLFLFVVATSQAQTVNLNMGAPGTIATDLSAPFSVLNGTPVDGRTINLTVQLPATAPLSLFSPSVSSYFLGIVLQTNSVGTPSGFMTGTGNLIDAMGAAISAVATTGGGSNILGQLFTALVFSGTGLADAYAYHWGASYSLTLPNDPGLQITGASFRVLSVGGPFTIGPHGPLPVPENGGTLTLLVFALAAFTIRSRHWRGGADCCPR